MSPKKIRRRRGNGSMLEHRLHHLLVARREPQCSQCRSRWKKAVFTGEIKGGWCICKTGNPELVQPRPPPARLTIPTTG
jgi:hypothetical protein